MSVIMSMQSDADRCKQCGKLYEDDQAASIKWCKPCQINYLKKNFTNWTSENKIIDAFIQEKQLNIDSCGQVFEWIPYEQFYDIEKMNNDYLATAIWKDGPLLYYDIYKDEWIR